MKKLSLFIIILIATCTVALSQPRAIGGRLPILSFGASYQHGIGEKNMLEVDLDLLDYWKGIQATVTYNWLFPIKTWNVCNMNWYAGVGAGGGYAWRPLGWYYGGYNRYGYGYGYGYSGWKGYGYGFVGAAGMIGIECNFKFGLQVSFDYRPVIGPSFTKGGKAYFFTEGLYISAINFGVRYKFGGK
jgi:hypothetical protein